MVFSEVLYSFSYAFGNSKHIPVRLLITNFLLTFAKTCSKSENPRKTFYYDITLLQQHKCTENSFILMEHLLFCSFQLRFFVVLNCFVAVPQYRDTNSTTLYCRLDIDTKPWTNLFPKCCYTTFKTSQLWEERKIKSYE